MMRVDDRFRKRQDLVVSNERFLLRIDDDVTSVDRMAAHLGELVGRQIAGLIEDAVGHTDLANVVQRREARERLVPLLREFVAKMRMRGERLRKKLRVSLRAPRV